MTTAAHANAFEALKGFSRRRPAQERCEVCGTGVAATHPHLLQVTDCKILCACGPCATLFSHRGDGRKLLRIPRDARTLASFEISDKNWAALRLPIELAFFVHSLSADRVVAYYPSPAGSTESLLSLDVWNEIAAEHPALQKMEKGVEALLADRTRGRRRYYIAPIDRCYQLTGLIRTGWRGFSGGEAVWEKVDQFFDSLEVTARA